MTKMILELNRDEAELIADVLEMHGDMVNVDEDPEDSVTIAGPLSIRVRKAIEEMATDSSHD